MVALPGSQGRLLTQRVERERPPTIRQPLPLNLLDTLEVSRGFAAVSQARQRSCQRIFRIERVGLQLDRAAQRVDGLCVAPGVQKDLSDAEVRVTIARIDDERRDEFGERVVGTILEEKRTRQEPVPRRIVWIFIDGTRERVCRCAARSS
jgi:hypothetical protein